MDNRQVKGQMNLFDGFGEELCVPFLMKKKEKSEKYQCTFEHLQKMFQKAIQIVKDEDFPLEDIDHLCSVKEMSAWGKCNYKGNIHEIVVSAALLETNEHSIMQTLLHEVLHATKGCHNHGCIWKNRAAQINAKYGYNIQVTHSPEEMGADEQFYTEHYRYVIECQECGYKFGYKKNSKVVKNLEFYRCGRCYGIFKRIK